LLSVVLMIIFVPLIIFALCSSND